MTLEQFRPINFSERLSQQSRERIVAQVSRAMSDPAYDRGGYEAWEKIIGADTNFAIGQLTHPYKRYKTSILQLATWYHPLAPREIRNLDLNSRQELMGMYREAAEKAWGERTGEIINEGFLDEDKKNFDPGVLNHNFFAYAGVMIGTLLEEGLLPIEKSDADEVIAQLPLFERIIANVRREGIATEEFDVSNLGLMIEAMLPKVEIPGLDFKVTAISVNKGINMTVSLGQTKEKEKGFINKRIEEKFDGIIVHFTLNASQGRLISAGAVSVDDSNIPGLWKTAANTLGPLIGKDLSFNELKKTITDKVANPQKSLEELLETTFESRSLQFAGLGVSFEDKSKMVFKIRGKVRR